MYGTRIVIADADVAFRRALKEVMRHLDYVCVGEVGEARAALQLVFQTEPHLVVLDPHLPGSESVDICTIIDEHKVAPIVAAVEAKQEVIQEVAAYPGVYGLLLKPLHEDALCPVVEVALTSFGRVKNLQRELKDLRRELETRKLVQRAKLLLMEKKQMTEKDAHRYLQKLAMDNGLPLAKVAQRVILALSL
ncbi:ANTAR domain-containing response regulator [Desulfurispora thermophila]|uniref:ANTAR domain-containing response regulator n=1 Tax=Desulfurispora thermophila TaxID=265470 RepID=UPI0004757E7C|nr:ANTAR domain-containing protein [Desulfurispora thermophila]